MLNRRFIVRTCLAVAIAAALLPSAAGIDVAEAGDTKLVCLGDSIVVHNPTDEQLTYRFTHFTSGGSVVIGSIGSLDIAPHAVHTQGTDNTIYTSIVEGTKGIRVLGRSDADTGSQGYSECVKTK